MNKFWHFLIEWSEGVGNHEVGHSLAEERIMWILKFHLSHQGTKPTLLPGDLGKTGRFREGIASLHIKLGVGPGAAQD